MKILVTGTNGQLGYDVINELIKRGHEAIGADRTETKAEFSHVVLDITDQDKVLKVVNDLQPDAIIHCAAWTNVDGAEEPENFKAVRAVNVDGTRNLAEAAAQVGAKMMYISTDYVFDGVGEEPWQPENNNYAPLNVYGQSKLDGEREVEKYVEKFFVVRIAWVFGKNGKNFVRTMVEIGKTHDTIRVVDDQIGTPTYTYDLARLLVDMIETDKYGYYHVTNEGDYISWADFAEEIFRQVGMKVKVERVSTAEYGASKAKRPFNSRLDRSKIIKAGFRPLPDWKDALRRYLLELLG